jgi:hypothetical protein
MSEIIFAIVCIFAQYTNDSHRNATTFAAMRFLGQEGERTKEVTMKRFGKIALAALALGGTVALTTVPADARVAVGIGIGVPAYGYGYGYPYYGPYYGYPYYGYPVAYGGYYAGPRYWWHGRWYHRRGWHRPFRRW